MDLVMVYKKTNLYRRYADNRLWGDDPWQALYWALRGWSVSHGVLVEDK